MPAVSPLAATATAPTSVGGAVSAEPGAFAQALARVEDGAKAAATTHVVPAREVRTEAASAEATSTATPPTTPTGADRPVTASEPETIATDESATTASAEDRGEVEGDAAPVGSPQVPQTVASQTIVPQSVAPQSVAAAPAGATGSLDLAVPGLNAEKTAFAEGVDETPLPAGAVDTASEAVQTAAPSAPSAMAAATAAASTPGVPLPGLTVRDRATGAAQTSRRGEGRAAEADGKSASAPRLDGLEGLDVQARATASVATSADGSAATLLSAQMAGQVTGDGQPEQAEFALGAAGAAADEAAPLTVAPAPTTLSGAPAGPATAVHGSQLAASTIETTAQLAAQIARRLEGRSTRFDMALTPDDLGRVDVSLDIDADGGLTARLAFDNPLAATELRGRADELRRQLQDAGFTVGADSLSFSEREAGTSNGGSDQRFERGAERAFIGAGRLSDDLETVAVPPAWISHSQTPQGVDLKV